MFIYPLFRGDENSSLREVQCNLFMSTVGIIVNEAYDNYFKAEKLLNIKTTLGDKIREREKENRGDFTFDPWTILGAYEAIAANYRYQTPYFPLFPDFPDKFDKDREELKWIQHLDNQSIVICKCLAFNRCCLIACVYANSSRGRSAEEYMGFYLAHRYGYMYGLALEKKKNILLESISEYTNWRNDLLSCVQCAWEGKYSQADQNNCRSIRDFSCPTCESTMTVIPFSSILSKV